MKNRIPWRFEPESLDSLDTVGPTRPDARHVDDKLPYVDETCPQELIIPWAFLQTMTRSEFKELLVDFRDAYQRDHERKVAHAEAQKRFERLLSDW